MTETANMIDKDTMSSEKPKTETAKGQLTISLRLAPPLYEKITQAAENDLRSINNEILALVLDGFKYRETTDTMLAELRRLIDHSYE